MNVVTRVWIGYIEKDVCGKLPDKIMNRFECEEEIKIEEIGISRFYSCDNDCAGIGVELLCYDWLDEAIEVDLNGLAEKVVKLKPKVTRIFKAWGVNDEPKVLLATGFDFNDH